MKAYKIIFFSVMMFFLNQNVTFAEEGATSTPQASQNASVGENQKSKKKVQRGNSGLKNKKVRGKMGDWAPADEDLKKNPPLKPQKSKYKYKGQELDVEHD